MNMRHVLIPSALVVLLAVVAACASPTPTPTPTPTATPSPTPTATPDPAEAYVDFVMGRTGSLTDESEACVREAYMASGSQGAGSGGPEDFALLFGVGACLSEEEFAAAGFFEEGAPLGFTHSQLGCLVDSTGAERLAELITGLSGDATGPTPETMELMEAFSGCGISMEQQGAGDMTPLSMTIGDFVDSISDTERSCVMDAIGEQYLEQNRDAALFGAMEAPPLPGECLERPTAAMVYTEFVRAHAGSLTDESAACVSEAYTASDSMALQPGGIGATTGGAADFALLFEVGACLNEEEFDAAGFFQEGEPLGLTHSQVGCLVEGTGSERLAELITGLSGDATGPTPETIELLGAFSACGISLEGTG